MYRAKYSASEVSVVFSFLFKCFYKFDIEGLFFVVFLILQRSVDWSFANTASLPPVPFQIYLCLFLLFLNCIR